MQEYIKERVLAAAAYILERGATVREAAGAFSISKSTVHKDMTERLPYIDPLLAAQVRVVLNINKAQRHIRGGQATYRKYKNRKKWRMQSRTRKGG